LLKLLKFVLVTRFSKQFLFFLPIFAIYIIAISQVAPSGGGFSLSQKYTGVAFTLFMLIIPVINGGLIVLKSDRDYLFTLPVSRRDLALSLFVAQFVSFGIVGFFLLGYDLPLHGGTATTAESIVDFLSLGLLATSLGPLSYALSTTKRVLIVLGLGVFALSALLGFPFVPSALFTGHGFDAALSAIVLVVILVPLAFRSLETVELDVMRALISSSSTEFRGKGKSFVGLGPIRAIYSQNFSVVELSGRMNMAGAGGAYRSSRLKMSYAILITTALAIVYSIVVLRFSPSFGNTSQTLTAFSPNPAMLIASIYLSISVIFMSMSVLGNERLWLGFTSMTPTSYLRNLVVAKALSYFVFISPFVAANIALALLGIPGGLSTALGIAIILPCSLILVVYITGLTSPIQIKEEMMMPGQINLRQMLLVLPMFLTIGLIAVSSIFLPFAIGASIFMVVLCFFIVQSKSLGNKLIQTMVNNGFV
jgi:hypothetical protein